jgi:NAD+ kinase
MSQTSASRFVLVVAHTGRTDAVAAAQVAIEQLHSAGITPVLTAADLEDLRTHVANQVLTQAALENVKVLDLDCKMSDLELVVVLGGDGTILKAAEIVREHSIPLMGINLGHVGFLAESER